MDTLLLYSLADAAEPCWLSLAADGTPQGEARAGELAEVARAASGRRLVWVLRGEDVWLDETRLAARNRRQLQQALPYALEDELAVDVERLYFAHVPLGEDTAVAAVDRALLDSGLARLAEHGLRPQRILPDVLLLPHGDDGGYLYVDGERALLRYGAARGLVCDRVNLATALSAALPGRDGTAAPLQVEGDAIQVAGDRSAAAVTPALPLLARLASGLTGAPAVDFATVPGLPGRSVPGLGRRWWLAAAIAGLALTLLVAERSLQLQRLDALNDRLEQQITSSFREAFPDAGRLVDPRIQMQQRLDALRKGQSGQDGFLQLLASAAGPLGTEQGVRVEGMDYREGLLSVQLRGTDIGQLERLKQALEAEGRQRVEIRSVNRDSDGVRAQLQLREGEA